LFIRWSTCYTLESLSINNFNEFYTDFNFVRTFFTIYTLSPSVIWGFFFFFLSLYLLLAQTVTLYTISFITELNLSQSKSSNSRFTLLISWSLSPLLYFFLLMFVFLFWTWSGPSVVSGFGHLTFTLFERKLGLLVWLVFSLFLLIFLGSSVVVGSSFYDFLITLSHFSYWLGFLFLATNVLTVSLVIEILTSLIMLVVVTSYAFTSQPLLRYTTQANYTLNLTPQTTYLYSLLTFFWVSLLTTLTLFLSLVILYTKVFTIEWSTLSWLTNYFIITSTTKDVSTLSFVWSLFLLVLFLKCAITPLYLWKPTFFKGLPLFTLFFYIAVFYFFIFIFFSNFVLTLFSDLLFLNTTFLLLVLLISTLLLPIIIYDSLNLKSFFALSSIMNSIIVLFILLSTHYSTVNFFL